MKRIVTGVDGEGRSYAVSTEDLPSPPIELWDYEPSDIEAWVANVPEQDAATVIEPPSGGARWVLGTIEPGGRPTGRWVPSTDDGGWHTTRTINFVYLVSGELTLLLDRESVQVQAGDVVVQQATRHAWRNETAEPAVMLALLHAPSRIPE